jgi:hypothetical protein
MNEHYRMAISINVWWFTIFTDYFNVNYITLASSMVMLFSDALIELAVVG